MNPVKGEGCLRRAPQTVIEYGGHGRLKVTLSGGFWKAAKSDVMSAFTVFQIVNQYV